MSEHPQCHKATGAAVLYNPFPKPPDAHVVCPPADGPVMLRLCIASPSNIGFTTIAGKSRQDAIEVGIPPIVEQRGNTRVQKSIMATDGNIESEHYSMSWPARLWMFRPDGRRAVPRPMQA